MTEQRDSFVFYRSFKECIAELSDLEKLIMYEAISDYALDRMEPNLTGFPKMLFRLIKPQLDANFMRWKNGHKGKEFGKLGGAPIGNQNARKTKSTPKQPLINPKTTPNENVNANENENVDIKKENNKKKIIQPMTDEELTFVEGMKATYQRVMNMPEPLTLAQYQAIVKLYGADPVRQKLEDMENWESLSKKHSANLTLRNWLRKDNK